MLSFREHCQLDEAFTNPLPIKVDSYPRTWIADFTVPGGADRVGHWPDKKYAVTFSQTAGDARGLTIPKELKTSDIGWVFTFQSDVNDDPFGVTGEGDAFAVFATVIHALKVFARLFADRPFIVFTAKEASRQKLYDRFVRLVKSTVSGMHGFRLINTPAVRAVLGNQLSGSAGLSSYVIVPTHISRRTVAKMVGAWHRKINTATHEFLSRL